MKENIDFASAIEFMAEKYDIAPIQMPDKRTPDEIINDQKKESIYIIYKHVQKYFVKQLEQFPKAKTYALSRWSEDQLKRDGFGYCPSKGLIDYAKNNSLSIDLMTEIGLIGKNDKGELYDFFYNRITIPIYDRYSRIIGYTARTIDKDNVKRCKYLNSRNSIVYQKSQSIFGINVAQNRAKDEKKIYLVEGAPDAIRLHSININNAIASLGGNWTEEHFKIIKEIVPTICFIPDADPMPGKRGQNPGEGDEQSDAPKSTIETDFGIGIDKVIKAGKEALKLGFMVRVKEIPLKEGNQKNDADEYFTSKERFMDLREEDFILWYARKKLDPSQPSDVNMPAIQEIAELVGTIKDSIQEKYMVNELNKLVKCRDVWMSTISEAKKRLIEANTELKENADQVSLKKLKEFGFQQCDNHYFSLDSRSEIKKWSNFVLEPLYHIKDSQAALRIFKITNDSHQSEIIELKQEDLISMARFNQKIESIGNFLWLAGGEQLTKLKQFLYKNTETATIIRQLGWNKNGFYAFGNGIFYNGEFLPVNDKGIVNVPDKGNFYLPAFSKIHTSEDDDFTFERSFFYHNIAAFSLYDYVKQMILVFGDNAKIGFAFLIATLFRDVVRMQTKSFPLLNIFGPKSSGKSHMGHCLTAFFISNNVPPNIVTSTLPALAESVAQSANALVQLDEFCNDIDAEKREFLKGLFDGTGRSRINIEKDKKRESTHVDSGVIITGQQMATADIALLTRFVFISFPKSVFTPEEVERFNKLMELRKRGCTHLTGELLKLRNIFERHFAENYNTIGQQMRNDLKGKNVEDRIITNWVSIVAAFATISDHINVPFTTSMLYDVAIKGAETQGSVCSQNTEVAAFWETITFLFSQNKVNYGCEYRIEHVDTLKVEEYSERLRFGQPTTILFLRYLTVYGSYSIHRNKLRESTLPKASLQYYLKSHTAYLGRKGSMLFHAIVDGSPVMESYKDKDGISKQQQRQIRDQVMCFDYDLLKSQYNINLEIQSAEDVEEVL